VEYATPEIRNIKVQNSPLWKNDPDQQLSYAAARSLARRHFPDVLLGVYTPEEMAEETMREVTPSGPPTFTKEPTAKIAESSSGDAPLEPVVVVTSTPLVPADQPTPAVGTEGNPESGGDSSDELDRKTMVADLRKRADRDGVSIAKIRTFAHKNGKVASAALATDSYTVEALQFLDESWDELLN